MILGAIPIGLVCAGEWDRLEKIENMVGPTGVLLRLSNIKLTVSHWISNINFQIIIHLDPFALLDETPKPLPCRLTQGFELAHGMGGIGKHQPTGTRPFFGSTLTLGLRFSVVQSHSLEALTCQTSKLHTLKNRNLVNNVCGIHCFTHLQGWTTGLGVMQTAVLSWVWNQLTWNYHEKMVSFWCSLHWLYLIMHVYDLNHRERNSLRIVMAICGCSYSSCRGWLNHINVRSELIRCKERRTAETVFGSYLRWNYHENINNKWYIERFKHVVCEMAKSESVNDKPQHLDQCQRQYSINWFFLMPIQVVD